MPFFGNLFYLIKHGDRQLEMFTRLRKTNADPSKAMSITVPGHRFIDITKPSASVSALRPLTTTLTLHHHLSGSLTCNAPTFQTTRRGRQYSIIFIRSWETVRHFR